MKDIRNLQDGNVIIGIAEGAEEELDLNEEIAGRIGGAFAYWLGFKVGKNPFDLRVCLGNDERASAAVLKEGIAKGITMFGAEPYDAGLAVTPAMFMSSALPQFDFDGAVMITASHLPDNMNGFKLFTKEGALSDKDVEEILKLAGKYIFVGEYFEERPVNLMDMYSAYLRQMISIGLKDVPGGLSGMHIIADTINGSCGFFTADVLEKLGADVSGSPFLESAGEGIRAVAGNAMKGSQADLGFIFDKDAGRCVMISSDGDLIAGDGLIALAAALAAEDYPGGTVVTDYAVSEALKTFLENKLGLKHVVCEKESNVINTAKELKENGENAFLSADKSGYVAFSDNCFVQDGFFLAVQILINAAKLKAEGKDVMSLIGALS